MLRPFNNAAQCAGWQDGQSFRGASQAVAFVATKHEYTDSE